MITKENIVPVFENLTTQEIEHALFNEGDFVLISLHTFSSGWFTTIESKNYHDLEHSEEVAQGNLYIDKDDFLNLYEETLNVNFLTSQNNK